MLFERDIDEQAKNLCRSSITSSANYRILILSSHYFYETVLSGSMTVDSRSSFIPAQAVEVFTPLSYPVYSLVH